MSPEQTNAEMVSLLRTIAKHLADIKASMTRAPSSGVDSGSSRSSGARSGAVASDRELDSQYGDPLIKSDPKRWSGQSYAGCKFSETEPDYLDCVAEFKEWQAGKDDEAGAKDAKGRPKSTWSRKDAERARGWSARLRAGWKPAGAPAGGAVDDPYGHDESGGYGGGGDADIPFITCQPNEWGL